MTPPKGVFVTRLTCQISDCPDELTYWPGSPPIKPAQQEGWREVNCYWRCPRHAQDPTAPSPRHAQDPTAPTAIFSFTVAGVLHRAVWLRAVPPHQPAAVVVERSEAGAAGTPRWAHWTRYDAATEPVLMALLSRLYPTPAKVIVTE